MVTSLALGALAVPSPLEGQLVGSYTVAGVPVPLTVLPDSFAVETAAATSAPEVEALLSPVLPGVAAVHRLGPRGWVVTMTPRVRPELRAAVQQIGALAGVVWAGFGVRSLAEDGPAWVTDQFMVRFQPGVGLQQVLSLNQTHGVEIVGASSFLSNHYTLRVTRTSPRDALAMASEYAQSPLVVYAHPNLVVTDRPAASWFPTHDPLFGSQWHHYNPGVVIGGIRADIHTPEAWGEERGEDYVTIGIVELGGFQADHDDLAANLWVNPYPDGTGPFPNKLGDVHGWNFEGCVTGSDPENDPCGSADLFPDPSEEHGTEVAGFVAEVSENDLGGLGVCPGCRMLLVRLSMTKDQGVRATGFQYADEMGSDVINVSFTTQYTDPTLIDTIDQIAADGRAGTGISPAPGTAIFAAAPDVFLTLPFDFCTLVPPQLAGADAVISVSSTDDHDQPANGATGACLDISAPGKAVWTTKPVDAYASVTGTSFATPIVAGVAGLLLSKNYHLTRDEIFEILAATADKVGTVAYVGGRNDVYGYGRVNAASALAMVPDPTIVVEGDPGAWEVGVRAGITSMSETGGTEHRAGLPGGGPLGAPTVYASWFPSASPLFLDLQLGLMRAWGSGYDDRFVDLALMAAYELSLGSLTLYVGASGANAMSDNGGGWSSEWGGGGVVGTRWSLSPVLRMRAETLWRTWSGLSVDEWGFALGFGVWLP